MRQFALSDAARVNLNSELPHHKSRQRSAAATAFVVAPLGAAERSHLIPFVALIGKLRLAQQELPPGKRLQLQPGATVGKLRASAKESAPRQIRQTIPAGEPPAISDLTTLNRFQAQVSSCGDRA